MINYIKQEIKHLPFVIVVFVLLYGITTLASSYAIGSGDIEFDNTGTSLQSTNVQGAVNEVFQHATDYNEIKSTIGNSSLTTTSQTLKGAINEIKNNVDLSIKKKSSTLKGLTVNYIEIGKVGFIEIDGTTTSTINEWEWFISGIAQPKYTVFFDLLGVRLQITNDNGNNIARVIDGGIANGTFVHFFATYTIID